MYMVLVVYEGVDRFNVVPQQRFQNASGTLFHRKCTYGIILPLC